MQLVQISLNFLFVFPSSSSSWFPHHFPWVEVFPHPMYGKADPYTELFQLAKYVICIQKINARHLKYNSLHNIASFTAAIVHTLLLLWWYIAQICCNCINIIKVFLLFSFKRREKAFPLLTACLIWEYILHASHNLKLGSERFLTQPDIRIQYGCSVYKI